MISTKASAGLVLTTALAIVGQVQSWVRNDTSSGIRVVQVANPPQNALPRRGAPIQVLNDPGSGGTVRFLINGQEQSLEPGQAIDLPNDSPQVVDFNSGGTAGDLQYSLYNGLYKFKVTDSGWGLFKSSGSVSSTTARVNPAGVPDPPQPASDLAHRRKVARADAVPTPPAPGITPRSSQPPEAQPPRPMPQPAKATPEPPTPQPPQPATDLPAAPEAAAGTDDRPPPPPAPSL